MRAVSDYCKLFARIWNDPDFIALDSDPQRVYMMLLSYPTRDNAGVLPLTMRRWVNATADMTVERFTAALQALAAARFIVIDWDTEEVLIRTFTKNDETYRQPKLWANAVKSALKVQSAALRRELLAQYQALPPVTSTEAQKITTETVNALVDTLKGDDGKGYDKGYTEGYPIPPGVGVSVSGVREHQHLHQAPAPTPAAVGTETLGTEVAPVDAPKGAATRGAYIAPDFTPNESTRQWARDNYGHLNLNHELDQFRSYWLGESGQRARKRDWNQAFRNWLGKNNPSAAPTRNGNGKTLSTTDRRVAEAQALKARYLAAENTPALTAAPIGEPA